MGKNSSKTELKKTALKLFYKIVKKSRLQASENRKVMDSLGAAKANVGEKTTGELDQQTKSPLNIYKYACSTL